MGFNEFCDPDIERAAQAAIAAGAARVVALDLMLMRGGDHAEIDVPRSIEPVRLMYAGVRVEAAWPFPAEPRKSVV